MQNPMLVLVAGPYRSGTNDQVELIEKNVRFMNTIALDVYNAGHLPVLGEWFALPLIETAGSKSLGDEVFNRIFHPVAIQLIGFCDAVLRVGGESNGADEMVKVGIEKGKIIFYNLSDVPKIKDGKI
jgi:GDP-mannose pyrophosphatase NudK